MSSQNPTSAAKQLVADLKGHWHGNYGMVCCPAHNDRNPSLRIKPGKEVVLFRCFAGCSNEAVIDALKRANFQYSSEAGESDPIIPTRDLSALARSIWRDALPVNSTAGARYKSLRGLDGSDFGRFQPAAITYERERRLALPALILPIRDDHEITAIQRIFLDGRTGAKTTLLSDAKRMLGFPKGGAIRLGAAPSSILNLAEGYEDAESVMIMESLDHVWAVCGIERYASIDIPDSIQEIRIWSQHGVEAKNAIERARTHLTSNNRSLRIHLPPNDGDWNDLLMEKIKNSNPSEPSQVIETSLGPIWVRHFDDTGTLRIWWPHRSDVGDAATEILRGRARWYSKKRCWYVAKTNVDFVFEQLKNL